MPVAPIDLEAQLLTGFDDPAAAPEAWEALRAAAPTQQCFLTRAWHRAWWTAFGEGDPLLVLVRRGGRPVSLVPLHVAGGMAFLAGVRGADYQDVVGESSADVMAAVLRLIEEELPGLIGLRLDHVPDASPTGAAVQAAAEARGWMCHYEGNQVAPALRIAGDEDGARRAADKKSLRRHERGLEREGLLTTTVLTDGAAILPELDGFFAQHVERWGSTQWPSRFCDARERRFCAELCLEAGDEGWLHFMRLDWEGRPIAFHLGFAFGASLLWYTPTFDVAHARRSPGEVLLRRCIQAALAAGVEELDLGLGEEAYKARYATHERRVRNWAAYRRESAPKKSPAAARAWLGLSRPL